MSRRNDEFDAVVIGAGHNGLAAACYLADAGLDVSVLEAGSEIGGMTASGRPIPEAPNHVVNYCAVDLAFFPSCPVAKELELHRYGLRTVPADPAYVYLHPDGASLALWHDPKRTADEIRRFSEPDATAFLEYAEFLDALLDLALPVMSAHPIHPDFRAVTKVTRGAARHRKKLRKIGSFCFASGAEVIDCRFQHPVIRSALYALGAGVGPIDAPGTSMTHLGLAFLHRTGFLRPVGGMQSVPDALANRLRAAGGRVLTSSPVAEILVSSNAVEGVRLTDGKCIRARHVIATCDPGKALIELLPVTALSPEMTSRAHQIPMNASGVGQMKVDLALSGRIGLSRHQRRRTDDLDLRVPSCLIGSPDNTNRSFRNSAAGLLPEAEDITIWAVVPTALPLLPSCAALSESWLEGMQRPSGRGDCGSDGRVFPRHRGARVGSLGGDTGGYGATHELDFRLRSPRRLRPYAVRTPPACGWIRRVFASRARSLPRGFWQPSWWRGDRHAWSLVSVRGDPSPSAPPIDQTVMESGGGRWNCITRRGDE